MAWPHICFFIPMTLKNPRYAQKNRAHARFRCGDVARTRNKLPGCNFRSAFTLVEAMMGVAVMGIMLVTLYGGFLFAFSEMRLARENVRATQILQEKMEVARLYNWDQVVNTPGYVPT